SKSIFNSINSEEEIYLTEYWSELLHKFSNINKINKNRSISVN
mgnify:CR=1